ncbi:MAG: hypothetical protein EOP48_10920 [Sphingobacteriales bacterium]|nr:MAG: hypothetical protein EOP48_10920 [Sphingobacteriales bacterium]
MTKNSIGKVWYSGRGKNHEFFTDSGMHPVDTTRRLLPVTDYIITKYTSGYRYILTKLVWAIGMIIIVVVSAMVIQSAKHKYKNP